VAVEKKTKEINGQTVEQRLEDSQFLKDWDMWKNNAVDYGFDFLRAHGVDSSRPGTTFSVPRGHQPYMIRLNKIMDFTSVVGEKEIEFLEKYKAFIEEAEGTVYDPGRMKYTEKKYNAKGEIVERVAVYGHWATAYFTERTEGKYGDAVDPSWYSYGEGIGKNPPHLAIYSATSTDYSKPKGLLYIIEDAIKELGKMEVVVHIRKVSPPGDLLKLPQVRQYLESLMTGSYFPEGKLKASAIKNALRSQKFKVSEGQEQMVRQLAKVTEEEVAGDVTHFTLEMTPAVIERIYMASSKKKAGGYFIHGKTMDKRPRKDGEVVAKSWLEVLHG
jgi:hypothetical protein